MTNYICVLAKSADNPFNGMLSGMRKPAGIILIVAGVLTVYIGVKLLMGYRFFPESNETIIEEKKYIPTKATVGKRLVTEMPSFSGKGLQEFVEWEISYDVEGVVYTQVVPDDNYSEGEILELMYVTDNPQEYYIDKPAADVEENGQTEDEKKPSKMGIAVIAVGVLLGAMGAVILSQLG